MLVAGWCMPDTHENGVTPLLRIPNMPAEGTDNELRQLPTLASTVLLTGLVSLEASPMLDRHC